MFVTRRARLILIAGTAALLLLACAVEEDLRLDFDGSGTYRVKVTIPKSLADGFGDLRKQAEKDGFVVAEEGETETDRFIVMRKEFTDVSSLNDDNSRFELTMTDRGLLRREYRFRATLQSVGFGAYQRHFTLAMPCNVVSASEGTIDGSRVQWNASDGGTIEVIASGFFLPMSRNQRLLVLAVAMLGVALLVFRRRTSVRPKAVCAACQTDLSPDERFCRKCGAGAPVAQT
jgi:hypothetical protein